MNNRRVTEKEIQGALVNLKQLTFEVTDACNLQCKYCGYGDLYFGYDKRESKYMTFGQAKVMIDYLVNIWRQSHTDSARQKTYISFYGGEPLLNMPMIKQTVEYIEQLEINRNFIFSMTTNAMLLHKYMDYLTEKKFQLLFSLDGDRKGHSYRVSFNGENSFDRVFGNIRALQQKYPEYFRAHVNFNSVLHQRNSVESIHRFIRQEFGKTPSISELNNSGIRPDKVEEFNRTYRNKAESLMESENYEQLSGEMFMSEPSTYDLLLYLHQHSGNVFNDYTSLFADENKISYTPTGTCVPFGKKMFVTVNGKIIQCERIDHRFALGEINPNGVNLDIKKVVTRFNGYLDKLQKQCEACYRNKSCIQCIYYISDIDEKHPVCHGFMNREQFERFSSHCLNHLIRHPQLYKKLMEEVLVE